MTSITWASLRYVQELTTILGPQNRTQGSCDLLLDNLLDVQFQQLLCIQYTSHEAVITAEAPSCLNK